MKNIFWLVLSLTWRTSDRRSFGNAVNKVEQWIPQSLSLHTSFVSPHCLCEVLYIHLHRLLALHNYKYLLNWRESNVFSLHHCLVKKFVPIHQIMKMISLNYYYLHLFSLLSLHIEQTRIRCEYTRVWINSHILRINESKDSIGRNKFKLQWRGSV